MKVSGMSKRKLLVKVVLLAMLITVTGCAVGKMNKKKAPGNPDLGEYGITFEIDWDIFDSGTFSYGPEGSAARHMGGTLGYRKFYILKLDFKFKDGREYHEEIDIWPLLEEMERKNDIPDLVKTRWGGGARIRVYLKKHALEIEYHLSEYIEKESPPQMLFRRHRFPVFKKILK